MTERTWVVFLIGRLSVAAADMLEGSADEGVRSVVDREGIAGAGRDLEVRHARQAIAVADAADHSAGAVNGRSNFGRGSAVDRRSGLDRPGRQLELDTLVWASGTLKTMRDEEPASSVCRC